jgi:RimJ/RimL family protein N-acetyltransferase
MPLDRQPTLSGPTLRLRPLRADDHDALAAVAADPLLWEQHPEPDRDSAEKFDRFFADCLASGGTLLIATADGEVIGSSRYDDYDEADGGRVEIGWTFLARSHWGGPTNRELKQLMLDHAFGSVQTVVFRVGVDNRRSRRAVEKLGAMFVDTIDTPLGPHAVYELSRERWTRCLSGSSR